MLNDTDDGCFSKLIGVVIAIGLAALLIGWLFDVVIPGIISIVGLALPLAALVFGLIQQFDEEKPIWAILGFIGLSVSIFILISPSTAEFFINKSPFAVGTIFKIAKSNLCIIGLTALGFWWRRITPKQSQKTDENAEETLSKPEPDFAAANREPNSSEPLTGIGSESHRGTLFYKKVFSELCETIMLKGKQRFPTEKFRDSGEVVKYLNRLGALDDSVCNKFFRAAAISTNSYIIEDSLNMLFNVKREITAILG